MSQTCERCYKIVQQACQSDDESQDCPHKLRVNKVIQDFDDTLTALDFQRVLMQGNQRMRATLMSANDETLRLASSDTEDLRDTHHKAAQG